MAITEDKRNDLRNAAARALGREEASTLMEHLPPIGWADVATKEYVDLRFELQEARFEAKLERALRQESYRVIGGVTVVFTLYSIVQSLLS